MVLSACDRSTLCGVRLFEGLPNELRDSVFSDAQVSLFPKGAILFRQGERATHFYVVLSGWVKLYRLQPDGTEAVIEIMGPGQAFAELAMHLACGYPATAEMATGGRLASFSSASCIDLLHDCPEFSEAMLCDISAHLQRFIERVESHHCRTTPQRLAEFLLGYCPVERSAGPSASFRLPYSKQLIANLLGMQPETLSRAVAVLRHHGVAIEGRSVGIRDLEALQRFVHREE